MNKGKVTMRWVEVILVSLFCILPLCTKAKGSLNVIERSYSGIQAWWGYFSENDLQGSESYGWGSKADVEAAIFIPKDHKIAGGATIKSIRIWLDGDYLSNVKSLKVGISESLTKNAEGALYTQDVDVTSLKSGVNEIELANPFQINWKPLYVGYSIGLNSGAYPIKVGGEGTSNAFYFRCSQEDSGYSEWRALWDGKLALQLLLDGITLENNCATPSNFGTHYAIKGDVASVPVIIYNGGKNPLSSITYTITTDGTTSAETTVKMNNTAYNTSETVYIDFPTDADFKEYSKTLTITKVNGSENMATEKSAYGTLVILSEKLKVVPVIEETTGTWCGWCTRGIVGLEMLNNEFGDDVITIAVHGGSENEPMRLPKYRYPGSGSYPSCSINRGEIIDPYFGSNNEPFGIKYDVEAVMTNLAPAKIEVKADWCDDTMTALNIETKTKFAMDIANQPYQIGYVLLEDGLTGSGSDWAQYNYYSGSNVKGDPNLLPLTQLPYRIVDMKYDHVPVAAWGTYYGIAGTLPKNVVHGEEHAYTFMADITGNTHIQNKNNLSVVAFLLNKNTGEIVNAAKYKLPINEVETDQSAFEFRYEGKAIDDNSTVVINAKEDDWGFGELNCETNPSAAPKNGLIVATNSGGQSGTAKLEILSNTLNPGLIQWCMGGECVPMNNKTSFEKTFTTDKDGIAQVQFDANNIKKNGSLEAKLAVTIDGKTRTVNIEFVCDNANGITIIYSDDENAVWHDMNGTRLENAPNRKGVYIKNGKKVIR